MKNKVWVLAVIAVVVIAGGVYTGYAPGMNVPDSVPENTQANVIVEETSVPEEVEPAEKPVETTVPEQADYNLNFDVNPDSEKYLQLNSQNYGWGFKKEKNKAPSVSDTISEMFRKTNTYYIGNQNEKVLYLTFDEGYENGYTSAILDVLKEKNVTAAFFITGPYLSKQTELVDRMVNEGHVVGNHTVNHPNLAKSELSVVYKELKDLNDAFFEKYEKNMVYMRPPEGEYSEKMLNFVSDMGYKTMLWSFAYKDWDVKLQKGSDYAFEQVTPYLHDGAILLLHAVSSDNAGALGAIIDYAREQGYEFRSIEEL